MRDDVPALIAAEQAARRQPLGARCCFMRCVADDPAMTQIILDQADRTMPEGER